jgi:hypothetical protein
MVQLKEKAVKKLDMIYREMPTKSETVEEPKKAMYVMQQPLHFAPLKEVRLEQWLCKWKVMEHLKISKSTYYRWREEGKLLPRNSIGEDRYLLEDLKGIVKKRND